MKNFSDLMKIPYKIEIVYDVDEGGYVASYPELKGCISCGETVDEAVKHLNGAKKDWLQAALEDGYPIPDPGSEESYSGQFKLRLPKSLHKALALDAKKEGVSMNQYCVYLLSKMEGSSYYPH